MTEKPEKFHTKKKTTTLLMTPTTSIFKITLNTRIVNAILLEVALHFVFKLLILKCSIHPMCKYGVCTVHIAIVALNVIYYLSAYSLYLLHGT